MFVSRALFEAPDVDVLMPSGNFGSYEVASCKYSTFKDRVVSLGGSAKEFAEITCIDLRVKHAKVIEHRTCDLNNSHSQGRDRATDI